MEFVQGWIVSCFDKTLLPTCESPSSHSQGCLSCILILPAHHASGQYRKWRWIPDPKTCIMKLARATENPHLASTTMRLFRTPSAHDLPRPCRSPEWLQTRGCLRSPRLFATATLCQAIFWQKWNDFETIFLVTFLELQHMWIFNCGNLVLKKLVCFQHVLSCSILLGHQLIFCRVLWRSISFRQRRRNQIKEINDFFRWKKRRGWEFNMIFNTSMVLFVFIEVCLPPISLHIGSISPCRRQQYVKALQSFSSCT